MTDRERFLNTAKGYIGTNGNFVCKTNLGLGAVYDWCAFAVSAIMKDCGFIGKYIKAVAGGAGDIPRISDAKYGDWFKKGTKAPQAGDLFFMRYADYPYQDKYFCDHVGIVESVNGNTITTLEGNVDGYSYNWAGTSTFKRKTRYLSDGTVYAFYRPRWSGTTSTSTSQTKNKSVDELAKEVIAGKWSAGDDDENSDRGADDFRRNHTECAIAVPIEDRYFGGSIRELTEFYRRKYWIHQFPSFREK